MEKIWFTQPAGKLASMYYYDTVSRDMVRIRLELGRDGNPKIMAMKNRYVAFVPDGDLRNFNFDEATYWTVQDHKISYRGATPLNDTPTKDLCPIDFSLGDERNIHYGNKVTIAQTLPVVPGYNMTLLLIVLAKMYIGKNGNFDICRNIDSETTLVRGLFTLAGENSKHAKLGDPAAGDEEKKEEAPKR